MDETIVIDVKNINSTNTKDILKSISSDLEDKGYNALKQITEYLLTGEIGYISSYKDCRLRISKLNRNEIVEYMLKEYLK